jgi:hypothetical protein
VNVAVVGVGKGGMCDLFSGNVALFRAPALAGVMGDWSSIEALIDGFRCCLRLVEERFFLIAVTGGIVFVNLAGDRGTVFDSVL